MRQTPDWVFETWVFHWTPSFRTWKALSNYFRADWYKTQKMAFTSTVHFFVIFPLASEYEFDNSKLAFVDYFDFLSFDFLRKSFRTCIWRKWLGVSVSASELSLLNVAFQIRRIKKNCSKNNNNKLAASGCQEGPDVVAGTSVPSLLGSVPRTINCRAVLYYCVLTATLKLTQTCILIRPWSY